MLGRLAGLEGVQLFSQVLWAFLVYFWNFLQIQGVLFLCIALLEGVCWNRRGAVRARAMPILVIFIVLPISTSLPSFLLLYLDSSACLLFLVVYR